MTGGAIGAIVEAMMQGPEGQDYASMSIAGIKPDNPQSLLLPERTFQYWPETLSDTLEIGWNFKDIAGGSHSLAQWGSNNGRTFTFEVQLHRFMKPVRNRSIFDEILDPFEMNKPDNTALKDNRPNNVDVSAEIRYLRACCYPSFKESDNGMLLSMPPPILMWCVPGMQLNEDGSDVIYAVMTGCDVTYTLCFPNGVPRRASVSVTLRQVVQRPNGGVWWSGHGEKASGVNPYVVDGGNIREPGLAAGGGRSKNKMDDML